MFRQRFRVRFRKMGRLRLIGHADLMRTFERALRRSGLPLGMTEGFNPHPRMSFPAPLGLGWEGEREVMEFELADWVSAGQVLAQLSKEMPEGLGLVTVELAAAGGRRKARAEEAEFVAEPVPGTDAPRVTTDAVRAFMAKDEFWAERRRGDRAKRDNIRPFVRDVSVDGNGRVRMRIAVSPSGTARPDEVLAGLGVSAANAREAFRIARTDVRLAR